MKNGDPNGRGEGVGANEYMEFGVMWGNSPFWKFRRQGEFKLWKPSVHGMLWIFSTLIAHDTVILVLKS